MSGESPQERHDAETQGLPPVASRDTIMAPVTDAMPEQIGHYHLKRRIGTGGMGTVYEAEQEHPHRTVALKVMKPGIASRSALRRFEYESEVLARLRHTGIAQVYEAGTHDDGSGGVPYFAMEYIEDARILTQYVEAERLDTDARLELFLEVCDAVHHGHQKGIIHRDLKPENILVDTNGHTKIIDFGIARATDSDLRAATIQTQVGELVGTVPYMSPEQCAADPHDIDTRSDVYALGICCYELLTGKLPYDVTEVAIYEATRIIREEMPTPFDPVNHELKGDIETIVFKALEKERDRRYQSAAAFGDDIRRYLKSQPILARPPSVYYQVKSFAKRNKALVAGVVAVMVALTVGFVGTTIGFVEARIAEAKAVKEAATARAVVNYIEFMFGRANPERAGEGKDVLVLDVMDASAATVARDLADQPEVRSELQRIIGGIYHVLGQNDEAQKQFDAALTSIEEYGGEPNPKLLADAKHGRSRDLSVRGNEKVGEAEILAKEALEIRLQLYEDGAHEQLAESYNQIAYCQQLQGRYDDAIVNFRRARDMRRAMLADDAELRAKRDQGLELNPDEQARISLYAASLNNVASCLVKLGEDEAALESHREALDVLSGMSGGTPQYPVAIVLSNIARIELNRGNYERAEADLRRALQIKIDNVGEGHFRVAITRHFLASVLLESGGNLAEAETEARTALAVRTGEYGPDDYRTGASSALLGRILLARGDADAAEPLLAAGLTSIEAYASEKGDPDYRRATNEALNGLAAIAEQRGDAEAARAYRARVVILDG